MAIFCCDCREGLRMLPDESVHCVITSPPYWGLRDYGLPPTVWGGEGNCEHEWVITCVEKSDAAIAQGPNAQIRQSHVEPKEWEYGFCAKCSAWRGQLGLEPDPWLYVVHLVEVFREVWRVLRKDGTLWLNLGSSYWGGKGQSGQANPEYQAARVEAGKSFSRVAAHIGGKKRMRPQDGVHSLFKPKDLVPIPWMVAMALQADGWWLRSDIIWSKRNPMPESVRDRCTVSHEYVFMLAKSRRYYWDQEALREPYTNSHHDGKRGEKAVTVGNHPSGRNRRSVWEINAKPFKEAHFATFPEKLVEPCILVGTSARGSCPKCGAPWKRVMEREKNTMQDIKANRVTTFDWRPGCECRAGDPVPCVVLDPFGGSGTVGVVAKRLGRDYILIDASENYCQMAMRRIAKTQVGLML